MPTIPKRLKKYSTIFQDAGLLMICTLVVNAGNYGLNLILGKYLGPTHFAEANVLAIIVMILSFIAIGIQLTIAKYAANFHAVEDQDNLEGLKTYFINAGKRFGLYSLPIFLLLTPIFSSYIQFESVLPLVILFIGIPLYILFSISRGFYQGTNQFNKLALSLMVEMLSRLIVTFALLYFWGSTGYTTEIVALGFLASFVATFLSTRIKNLHVITTGLPLDEIKNFMMIIGVYELSQILINNSDIILVKHFMDSETAGLYAAIALIGKVVFFATWTIVTLLFPKVIEKEKKGENHKSLFWGALAFVAIIGLTITAGCYFFNTQIIETLFSKEYLSSASLLWIYALMTCCFACANVFAYYHMSLNNYTPVKISLSIGLLQIICIYLIHHSLYAIILVQLCLMITLLIAMITYHFISSNTASRIKTFKDHNNRLNRNKHEISYRKPISSKQSNP